MGYEPFLPKSSASAETVAWLLDQKYNLGLPLYRLEQNVQQQMGLNLSRQTMSNWILKAAELYVESMIISFIFSSGFPPVVLTMLKAGTR
ncbi:MAG TPA: hypothetical protein DEO33_02440 [Rikenellaceae bacterium]|nr:hypothetical protein [Rikenellaceae bacterium]